VKKLGLFSDVLNEIEGLRTVDILRAFAAIPSSWGLDIDFRVKLAKLLLDRRVRLRQTVVTFCS